MLALGRRYFFYGATFLSRGLLFPLYFLSGLVPRRDDLWVFGSWGGYRYADNAAALFRFCHARRAVRVELVWISRRREIVRDLCAQGYDARWIWSVGGMAACLRAGVYLFDCFSKDINFWLSRNARHVNLWSGVPLKTFERDIDHPANRYYRLFHGNPIERALYGMMMPWHLVRPDLIIATSDETAEITRRAFDIDTSAVVVTGFPRNDAILAPDAPSALPTGLPGAFAAASESGKRIFLYLPTFRDSGKPFLRFDWARLASAMVDQNAVFFCKSHPVDRGHFPTDYPQIVELGQDTDVYALLPHTDILISDYSSIIFDFQLLGRPIVYYTPDLEEFVTQNRSLNFDPEDVAVGPICRTFDELLTALAAGGSSESPEDARRRDVIRARLHSFVDAGSSERVLEAIYSKLALETMGPPQSETTKTAS